MKFTFIIIKFILNILFMLFNIHESECQEYQLPKRILKIIITIIINILTNGNIKIILNYKLFPNLLLFNFKS